MWPSSKPDDQTDTQACREKALDLLARREHGRVELSSKLEARGFDRTCVATTVEQLVADRLQDDVRFAESFVQARAARGQGPLRIASELRARRLADSVAEQALRDSGWDWIELASQVRAKRFGIEPPDGLQERARQQRFLASRGFSNAHIRRALDLAGDSD